MSEPLAIREPGDDTVAILTDAGIPPDQIDAIHRGVLTVHEAVKAQARRVIAEEDTRASLPSSTAAEIFLRVPPATPWIAYPLAAPACATSFVAAPKCGKTTYLLSMYEAILSGREFLGNPTTSKPIIHLAEDGPTAIRHAIQRANLRSPDLHITSFGEAMHLDYPELMALVRLRARQIGAGLVVIDTFSTWARIAGEEENNAAARLEAFAHVRPLLADGLAVILVGHTRKSGGDVVDAGRGSGALAGAVDTVAMLERANDVRPTRRLLTVRGRLDGLPDDPVTLDRVDGEYRLVDLSQAPVTSDLRAVVLGHVAIAGKRGLTSKELQGAVGRRKADTLATIRTLEESGEIVGVTPQGGSAKRYTSGTAVPDGSTQQEPPRNHPGTDGSQVPNPKRVEPGTGRGA